MITPGDELEKHHGVAWKKTNRNFVPYDDSDLEDMDETNLELA